MDFYHATHTIVLSDMHLADIEPGRHRSALWKKFKKPEYFMDGTFQALLTRLQETINGPIELVLNGDIFDFDSVMTLPKDRPFHISWLERKRGLNSEETKSRFKMKAILDAHPVWISAVREFILGGNRVIFNIGNHDMELHWTSVQQDIITRLKLPDGLESAVRFTEWFYISNGDTLIEHGNQYDPYCVCGSPINPLVSVGSKTLVQIPFGNLAGKYILNGMGLINPHFDSAYIKETTLEYLAFFFRYMLYAQPLILGSWFWSVIATMYVSVRKGFRRPLVDPLTIDSRVDSIAHKANSNPKAVWALKALHAHPAIFSPIKVLQELWLDRAFLLLFILFTSFEAVATVNMFTRISMLWIFVPFAVQAPLFALYAKSVKSDVEKYRNVTVELAPVSAQIVKVSRVIHGHTHVEKYLRSGDVEYVNTGNWSPAFHDVECTKPVGKKCFAWIRPAAGEGGRICGLYEWTGTDILTLAESAPRE